MSELLVIVANAGEYTLLGGAFAVITALSSAVTYLWRRAEKEFDECKADRLKLWQALYDMGYEAKVDKK